MAAPQPPRRDTADRAAALRLTPVSRETEERLALYVDLLGRWQRIKNLVGPSTLAEVWTRHIADSAQLVPLCPEARLWVDLGSGAGFPGLVIAILLHDRPGIGVHLIEANGRKCAFLREVARQCAAPAQIHNGRIEDVLPELETVDVVTARALAPLPQLFEMGKVMFDRGARGLFLKSAAEVETFTQAGPVTDWSVLPSKTSQDGRILSVRFRSAAAQGHSFS
jgi:16S rRNA (guanine527-N7)-methyltransferase